MTHNKWRKRRESVCHAQETARGDALVHELGNGENPDRPSNRQPTKRIAPWGQPGSCSRAASQLIQWLGWADFKVAHYPRLSSRSIAGYALCSAAQIADATRATFFRVSNPRFSTWNICVPVRRRAVPDRCLDETPPKARMLTGFKPYQTILVL